MTADFSIPMRREELLKASSVNYFVDEVLPLRVLPAKIQECKSSFRSSGPQGIQNTFTVFFSLLENFSRVEPHVVEEAWKLIIGPGLQSHITQLGEALQKDIDHATRRNHLNNMKMLTYVVCQMIELAEFSADSGNIVNVATAKGRKKTVKQSVTEGQVIADWEEQREKALNLLHQLMQMSIQRLWEPPIAEEEFVSLVTNSCYRLMEKPTIIKKQSTRDAICWLLGTAVAKYNHGLSCSIKLIQLLQLFEHLAPFVATAVSTFAAEFGVKTVASDMIREISRMNPADLAKDTSGTRSYASFLMELAEKVPAVMLPNLSLLQGLLDGESYSMRNSVLSVLGELIIRVLSDEKMDAKQRSVRESCLDKLEDHVHDVSAFVRSKALQIWYKIATEKALPLNRQHTVLHLAIDRLIDKSSQVRKAAIQLISVLIQSNPFATKIPIEMLKSTLDDEQKKLNEMDLQRKPIDENDLETQWLKVAKDVKIAVENLIENKEENDDVCELADDETAERVFEKIASLMKSGDQLQAVKLFQTARDVFSEAKPYKISVDDGDDVTSKINTAVMGLKLIYLGDIVTSGSLAIDSQPADAADNSTDYTKQQVVVEYLKDSVSFLSEVELVFPSVLQLLFSKVTSDIMEAIEFFVTAYLCGLKEAEIGIQQMLPLIWSKEGDITNAVVNAYRRIFLSNTDCNKSRNLHEALANNLLSLTLQVNIEDAPSLQRLIQHLLLSADVTQKTLQMLWDRVLMKPNSTLSTSVESRAALTLLAMAASEDINIARSRLDSVITEVLAKRANDDLMLGREACIFLQRMQRTKGRESQTNQEPYRLPENHKLFNVISTLLTTSFEQLDKPQWIPLAEEAVNTIFSLAEHPDLICAKILKSLASTLSTRSSEKTNDSGDATSDRYVSPRLLSRFVFVTGHVALRELLLLEVDMFAEIKRRQTVIEEDHQKSSKQAASRRVSHIGVSASSRKKQLQQGEEKGNDEDNLEDEMGLAGAAAEDAEAEAIRKVAEMEILTGSSLLAVLQEVIVALCANQMKHSDAHLATSATLSFSKLMIVSSKFCDTHLQLLFTILEKSTNPQIRANIIIALGDLAFRFPNLIEPWTAHLYSRLRDTDNHVRRTTLLVLSRLILHDMVKVKGQISELACCITDGSAEISGLAKAFFLELSQKGNAIYNIMPDMVSRLSDSETGISSEDNFRTTMKYLFSFIHKDKQCESLVEKLCHRFPAARSERQWRDLAFCMAQLSYSDKSLQKLHENFALFVDKLASKDVFDSFVTIVNGAKKFAKPETKTLVDELEDLLNKCHEKGVEDMEAIQKAAKASTAIKTNRASTAKNSQRQKKQTKNIRSTASRQWTQLEEGDEDEEEEKFKVPKKLPGRKTRAAIVESESDSDLELFDVTRTPRGGTAISNDSDDKENSNITVLSPEPHLIRRKSKGGLNNSIVSTPEITEKAANTRNSRRKH